MYYIYARCATGGLVVGFALREQLKRESTSYEIETPEEDKDDPVDGEVEFYFHVLFKDYNRRHGPI